MSNIQEMSDTAASKSLEVLKQISSTGYLRKRVPNDLVVLQGGAGSVAFTGTSDASAAIETIVPAVAAGGGMAQATSQITSAAASMSARDKAKMQGYEGEACGECGNYTLVRNGTCMKCNTCGGTSGCS